MVSEYISVKQKKLLKQHNYILRKLASSNVKDKKIILENAPSELFKVLNLLFRLIADEKLSLTRSQDRKIKQYRQLIRTTSSLKGEQLKKKLLRYRSGALKTILKTILPVIGGILSP